MEGSLLGRSADMFAVDVSDRGSGTAVVTARGVIDLASHAELEQVVRGLLAGGDERVILDLSGVTLCDSTGLSALIRLHRAADADTGWLRLAAVPPQVQRVLDITDLTRLLYLFATVDDARIDT